MAMECRMQRINLLYVIDSKTVGQTETAVPAGYRRGEY